MSRRKAQVARTSQQQKRRRNATLIGLAGLVLIAAALVVLWPRLGPPPTVAAERLDQDPVLGSADAPVTIVEYGAYGCPACASWHQSGIVEQIVEASGGQVNFIYRDMPIIAPAYDNMAAELAQCALDQGEDLYWAFHDQLYSAADRNTSRDTLISLAGEVGLDTDALRACADAGTHRATVSYDEDRGRALGINSTPTFYVNGVPLTDSSPEALQAAVDAALNS